MTTTTTAPPELTRSEVRERIAAAAAARDEGIALAELGDTERGGIDRKLIDQAIEWFAQTYRPFSANDFRELLPPDLRVQGLMGARFRIAKGAGLIEFLETTTSTKRNTHCKPVGRWCGIRSPQDELNAINTGETSPYADNDVPMFGDF